MKNELKIKTLIAIMIMAIIVVMNTFVLAEDTNYSAGISLTSNSKLKEGETVTVNVKLTSVNAGAGIDALTAKIEYDTNVFEELATTNFTSSTGWTPAFSSTTNKMTLLKSEKVTSEETIFTINLKVKSSISVDSTKITLKDIVASGGVLESGGTGDIVVNNSSVTINREKTATTTTEKPENNKVIQDITTTTKTTLPKTGIKRYGAAIILLMVIAIIGIILYKKIAKDVK